jgi:thiol-disulfide isomerase/thioredoxin
MMERLVSKALACLLVLTAVLAAGGPPSWGQAGPPLQALSGGDQLAESDLERGAVVVIVWASWSPRCKQIVEQVNDVVGRWGDQARVVTVVFQEESSAVRDFLGSLSLQAPVFLDRDGGFSRRHAVTTLPGLLIFKDGQRTFRGRLPADPHHLIGQSLG